MAYHWHIIFSFVFLVLLSFAAADGVQSLGSSDGFNGLRSCAHGCYDGGSHDGSMLEAKLACDKPGLVYQPSDNDCFCRPDLQEIAVRHLSTCVYTSCTQNQLDISSATQVYKDYCSSAGYTAAAPVSVAAQPTTGGNLATTTWAGSSGSVVNTGAPNSNQTAGDSARASDSGLSLGAIIGISAGVVSAVAAVVGCLIKCMQYKKQKRQAQHEPWKE